MSIQTEQLTHLLNCCAGVQPNPIFNNILVTSLPTCFKFLIIFEIYILCHKIENRLLMYVIGLYIILAHPVHNRIHKETIRLIYVFDTIFVHRRFVRNHHIKYTPFDIFKKLYGHTPTIIII